MGGCNSTRWNGHTKKLTVDDSFSIDANLCVREGGLREGIHQFGSWHWLNGTTGERTSSIGYELDTTNVSHSWIRLFYTITRTGEEINYKIRLCTTRPNFGGLRWWFICPLVVNGRACNRRVGKLHLPPSGRYFGCRHCYALTYRSCQEADKRLYWLRNNPEALIDIIHKRESADPSKLFLAMKALRGGYA